MNAKIPRFHFAGGNLALDFVNTVANRGSGETALDRLATPADVCDWATLAGLPGFEGRRPPARMTARAVRGLRAVRERLYTVFLAMVQGRPIPPPALQAVDGALRACRRTRLLQARGTAVQWAWSPNAGPAHRLLCPVLMEAAALLTSDSRGLVRLCADAGCGWLFLDRSRAGKRKWCRMADCGNRAKARRHYRRSADSSTGRA